MTTRQPCHRLPASIGRLQGDPATLLISGVTSAHAATVSISLGDLSLSALALSSSALPGLWFYVVQIPTAEYPTNAAVNVEAVAADGTALLRNDPRQTAPLLPPLPSSSSPGPEVIWPTAGYRAVKPSSALALAQDVAEQILGIPNPNVTARPNGYTASISIHLPATGNEINGIAQLQTDHSWALIQLGTKANSAESPTFPTATLVH